MSGSPGRYFQDTLSVSASPGFTWGRSGNVASGTWLLNDTVPSNKAGRLNFLIDAEVISIFVSSETVSTFDVSVYEHSGGVPSLVGTVSVVAQRGGDFTVSLPLTTGQEIAVQISSGSAKNPQVGLIINGGLP
ncbi:MAG: hypothetical protein GY861_17900 [bacterium]|nr:hypothetical protein [bacterium]